MEHSDSTPGELRRSHSDNRSSRNEDSTEYLASRRSRREFLAELRDLTVGGLAVFGLSGLAEHLEAKGVSADSLAEGLYPDLLEAGPGGIEYPPCLQYHEFSDGGYCTPSYSCGAGIDPWSFQCQGGLDQDFECASFTCDPQFTCDNGFDAADCDNLFACDAENEFGCWDGDFDARGCEPTQRFLCHPGIGDPYTCQPASSYTY